jgi:hypothetical protein
MRFLFGAAAAPQTLFRTSAKSRGADEQHVNGNARSARSAERLQLEAPARVAHFSLPDLRTRAVRASERALDTLISHSRAR